MYYLQSRYYDPEVGRFVNADDVVYFGADGNITSFNLFTYCGNCPVYDYDPTGHFAISAITIIGGVVGGLISGVSAALNGCSISEVFISTLSGATTGALCTMGALGVLLGATVNGLTTSYIADDNKLVRGAIAFGSTFFWGSYGNWLIDVAGNGIMENLVFDLLFGSVAEIVTKFCQDEATTKNSRNKRIISSGFEVKFEDYTKGTVLI